MEAKILYDEAGIINFISDYLENCFREYKWSGFLFKSTQNPDEAELNTPRVFRFLCSPDDINEDGYPDAVPSVTLMMQNSTLSSTGELNVSLSLHTALCSPSTAESEIAHPVEGSDVEYEISGSTCFSRENAQHDLYESSIVFTSRLARIVRACPLKIADIQTTPADASLPDFPYITSRIDFSVSLSLPKTLQHETENAINTFINSYL